MEKQLAQLANETRKRYLIMIIRLQSDYHLEKIPCF